MSAIAETTDAPEKAAYSSEMLIRKLRFYFLTIYHEITSLFRACWFALENESAQGNLFLFVPVFLAGGAFIYYLLPVEPYLAVLLAMAVIGALLVLVSRSRPLLNICLWMVFVLIVGVAAACFETWRAQTAMLGSEISTRLTARVVRSELQESGRTRLILDVIKTERPQLRYAPERVRVTARAVPDNLQPGDVVVGAVRLMPPSGPVRPQSYDFSFRSYFDGIGAIGFFLSNPELAPAASADYFERASAWVENVRQLIAARVEQKITGAEGAIAAALITGIRAGIPEEINEALRVVGLYHVISISGLHMALVGGTLMISLRCIFALSPSFSMRWPVKKYAAGIALVATALYLLMSGADVAAQRSFIMLAVMLIAVMFDRAALTMRNLAISAIIILLWAPHEIVGPSFQMSFAATAALVAAYDGWTRYKHRNVKKSPIGSQRSLAGKAFTAGAKYTAGMSMTSIIAGIATALFTAWHFQQVSTLGLVANLAAMPFVSIMVMPMAVLACIAMPFGLDAVPLYIMGQGIAAMNTIALWLADYSFLDRTGAIPLIAVLFLTVSLILVTMLRSRLLWLFAPFALVGTALLFLVESRPAIIISEDGRLVAMKMSDGTIAVNRNRPNGFALQNWMRAFAADDFVKPVEVKSMIRPESGEQAFNCYEGVCIARHSSGAIIAHLTKDDTSKDLCDLASLIVIDAVTTKIQCSSDQALVISKRDLAQRGSAEIQLRETEGGTIKPEVFYAIQQPYRPWHEHRRFSRAARGLEPYKSTHTKSES